MSNFGASNVISGKFGRVILECDGELKEFEELVTFEANYEKEIEDITILNKTNTDSKATGGKGSGSITTYYVSSFVRRKMVEYSNTGKDFYCNLTVINEDPTVPGEKQVVTLTGVNFTNVIIAKIDTGTPALDESMDFTFAGMDIQESFSR